MKKCSMTNTFTITFTFQTFTVLCFTLLSEDKYFLKTALNKFTLYLNS